MVREELKWQNIDADDLPAHVKKSFDAMVEAEAAFKADLEKLLKNEGHMPEDKFLVMSRKGKRLGVLRRHKSHRRPRDCFADCGSIVGIATLRPLSKTSRHSPAISGARRRIQAVSFV